MSETPIYKMNYSDGNNSFYIKREDLLPFSFGGNKARKADLFFKEIDSQRNDCVVTYGSSSSNHCRIIANMAASRKIPCYLISPVETGKLTVNSQMMELFGADIIQCPVIKVNETINAKLNHLKAEGNNPFFIPGGGHGNIGTQAYTYAYREISAFEKSTDIHFDYIFHASGTGTTQAGLICGMLLQGDTKRIAGISIARKNPGGGQVVLNSVNEYLGTMDRECADSGIVDFIDDYVLDGYGAYNREILQTIREVLVDDGIPLDTTYTGKAFWGMKEYIKENRIMGRNILFIHTGGTPLFYNNFELICQIENL